MKEALENPDPSGSGCTKRSFENILREAHDLKYRIQTPQDLEQFRVKFLGRKGLLRQASSDLTSLKEAERRETGQHLNRVRRELESIISDLEIKFQKHEAIHFDFRHPGRLPHLGHTHLLSQALERAQEIFCSLGFSVIDSPEIVTEKENFDSLNIPPHHPARDLWDTLWVEEAFSGHKSKNRSANGMPAYLFRTQTSAYQVEYLRNHKKPFRVIIPGTVFRHEATDRTHDFQFQQIEGLVAGGGANLSELKGVLEYFFSTFLNQPIRVRFRQGYFPFVEPGLEVDISCVLCKQEGCSVCKHTGWLEIAGAGMVHPSVLRAGGWDPCREIGYAFGIGWERVVMLTYHINDIRFFRSGDLRFIRQF